MKLSSKTVLLAAVSLGDCSVDSDLEQALFDSYAPIFVDCPADIQWIRPPIGLSEAEADWVHGRKRVVLDALEGYLGRANLEAFDVCEYVQRMRQSNYCDVPTIGLAISGGGWASAFTGTGALRALDSRLDAANDQRTGGLLQSLIYLSGISGGSWPTASFALNDFPTADEIVDIWHPEIDRVEDFGKSTQYAANSSSMFKDLAAKQAVGFNVSAADYFGRAWAYEFIPGAHGGLGTTWSSVVNQSKFLSHQMPFPIIESVSIIKSDLEYLGLQVPTTNDSIYEMTPFEFGAWGGPANGFMPMEWLGTRLDSGSVVNASACVQGFDRASWMIGVSGGAFNYWYIQNHSNETLATFSKRSGNTAIAGHSKKPALSRRASYPAFPEAEIDSLIEGFQNYLHLNLSDISYAYSPNPFAGLASSSPFIRKSKDLKIVDESEGGQSIPLWALSQPARSPSFIITWDDNGDGHPYNWNNGTNLYDTYTAANASGLPFPIVPSASTFVNRNYTTNPVFFGCEPELTTTNDTRGPIVLYLANAPYSAYTNYSYTQSHTSREQISEIFVNSFNHVTQGNGTLDAEWPVCLACAAIDRSLSKVAMERTEQCAQCFNRYCWDGVSNDTQPGIIDPPLLLNPSLGFLEWNKTHPF